MQTKPGQVLDTKTLGQDLKRIYAIGAFEIVSYSIVQDGERNILRITPSLKPWGPTYLKLGLFLGTDFQFTTQFGVTALVDATELNSLGGQWKTTVTVGSPLELKTRFYPAALVPHPSLPVSLRGLAPVSRTGVRRSRTRSAPTRSRGASSAWTSATTSGPGASCAWGTPAPSAAATARSAARRTPT